MRGDLYIYDASQHGGNPEPSNPIVDAEWLDCWVNWGVGLEAGALDALMCFKPNKEPIVNKNVTADGASYVTGAGHVDERTVSIPFHIVARNKADFLLKRQGFYDAIKTGLCIFRIANPVEATYKLYYVSCNQYTQFLSGVAKFMLTMYETNGYDDTDPASVEPMPEEADWEAYLYYLMQKYGKLATETAVRNIVRNY